MPDQDVAVEVHPPERGRRSLILASGCCTSCCCCSCCLHSVGALAGAAVGASLAVGQLLREGTPPPVIGKDGKPSAGDLVSPSAVVLSFWVASTLGAVIVLGSFGREIEVSALILAVVLPLVLLAVLAAIFPLAAFAGGRGLRVWAKILAGVVIGTLVGGAAMAVLIPIVLGAS